MTNTPYIIYWFISSCRGNETRTRIPTKVRTPNAVGNQLPVTPLFIGNIFLLFLYQLSYLPKLFDFVGRVRLELTTLWLSVKCLLKYLLCVSFICISLYEYCAKIYKIFLISKFSMNFFYLKPHFSFVGSSSPFILILSARIAKSFLSFSCGNFFSAIL